jgi:streptomycin 6-kinase
MVSGLGATVALARVGGPKVFAVDATIPAMLMERLVPGTKLLSSELSDLEQLEVMALGMITFRTLPWAGCLGLSDFFLRESALKDHLLSTTDEQCFLHGDYHQDNVLWDGVNWRPIDPKGLVGDPHLEPVAFLRNPLESVQDRPDLLEFTRDRIVAFAERLGLDPWRIAAWSAISERDEDGDTPLALVCDALMEWFGE